VRGDNPIASVAEGRLDRAEFADQIARVRSETTAEHGLVVADGCLGKQESLRMAGTSEEAIEISHGNKPNDLFPGYYPPSSDERRDAYRRGLVSLDANALLDLYRFSERARNEFFAVLETLRPRLFVTHQATLEFYRNRLAVVESRLSAAEEKCKEIEQPLRTATEKIQEFANRYRIDEVERKRLIDLVQSLSTTLTDAIRTAGAYDLTKEQVRTATDNVLRRFESLVADRVGDPLTQAEYEQAIKEATRRRERRIPPGYADKKASPELQAGDYLVWRQLIGEARIHDRPVLLVTNEQKEDWILVGSSNQTLGPRPELVLEMRREAHSALHMVTVVGLLKEAPEYIGTSVSISTIQEAESLPDRRHIDILFSRPARRRLQSLSPDDQDRVTSAFDPIISSLRAGRNVQDLSEVRIEDVDNNRFLVEWPPDGTAVFEIKYEWSGYDIAILVLNVTKTTGYGEGLGT
jgi:PIN like domain